jgi:hypothetical protein
VTAGRIERARLADARQVPNTGNSTSGGPAVEVSTVTTMNPSETVDHSAEQLGQLEEAIRAQRCLRCGGILFFSRFNGPGEWACLQCGRTYRQAAHAGHPAGLRRPARWTR